MSEISYFYANFARICVVFWKILHSWTYIYTTTVCDGRDNKSVMIVIMFGVGEEERGGRVAMRRNVESPRNEVTAPTNHPKW